jgi:hypothetical protein
LLLTNYCRFFIDLREGIEAKLNEISGNLTAVKKQIVALGFNNKDNALDDPEIVHNCAQFTDWKLKDYVRDTSDAKALAPLTEKLKSCEQLYMNQIKLQAIKGMLELTITAKPVPDKQELEKLKSKSATDVHGENVFVKQIFGK